jgi:hypothetical protein
MGKYYIINPTTHAVQIYDLVRVLPGSEEEPSVTECVVNDESELEAIRGVEGWGLTVLSEQQYQQIINAVEPEEDEEVTPGIVIEKITTSTVAPATTTKNNK